MALGPLDRRKGGPGGWIILDEPELHLEVYRAASGAWLRTQVAQSAEKIHAEPFSELELDLAALWER